nr:uncharacterized protein CI109_001821 [Kwoniella shandongensis]KAA5529881.1 hypothetical protein CI109_001821 [Kwoniella shandongensis]
MSSPPSSFMSRSSTERTLDQLSINTTATSVSSSSENGQFVRSPADYFPSPTTTTTLGVDEEKTVNDDEVVLSAFLELCGLYKTVKLPTKVRFDYYDPLDDVGYREAMMDSFTNLDQLRSKDRCHDGWRDLDVDEEELLELERAVREQGDVVMPLELREFLYGPPSTGSHIKPTIFRQIHHNVSQTTSSLISFPVLPIIKEDFELGRHLEEIPRRARKWCGKIGWMVNGSQSENNVSRKPYVVREHGLNLEGLKVLERAEKKLIRDRKRALKIKVAHDLRGQSSRTKWTIDSVLRKRDNVVGQTQQPPLHRAG